MPHFCCSYHRVSAFIITELAVFCLVIWRSSVWEDGGGCFGSWHHPVLRKNSINLFWKIVLTCLLLRKRQNKINTRSNRSNLCNYYKNLSYSVIVTNVASVTPCIFLFPQFLSWSPQKYPFYLRFPLKVLFFHEFSLYYTAILTTKYNINSKNQYVKKVLI